MNKKIEIETKRNESYVSRGETFNPRGKDCSQGTRVRFFLRVACSINPAEIYAKSPSCALFRPGEVKQGREESSLVAACVRLLDVPA